MQKEDLQAGIELLKVPVLPLVSMVQFLYLTGSFSRVEDVIDEMPEPVETGYALYEQPRELLRNHLEHLCLLEHYKQGEPLPVKIVDEAGNPVDEMSGWTSLINQRILEDELAPINSQLCAPCSCSLCCVGPETAMQQDFFEIPLLDEEIKYFNMLRHDSRDSRTRRAMDESSLHLNGTPFYQETEPQLIHWQDGWSLILPKNSSCPGLEESGRCRLYTDRPQVCRKPQIFSYILENIEDAGNEKHTFRLRNCLLAVTDCPYVQLLQDEIGAYAAACELELVLKENKQ